MSDYSSNFPQQRPKLNLVFNSGSDKLDSRISYTRSSSGTAFSAEKHLSSENLLPYSNDLSNASWTKANTTASSGATGPDGTANASSVLETTANDGHSFYDNFEVVNGVSYTFVAFVKGNGRTKVKFQCQAQPTIANVEFDLTAVTSTVLTGSAVSHAIVASGGTGWYRCSVTVVAGGTGAGYHQIHISDGSSYSYAGDITKGVFIFGTSVSSTQQLYVSETSGQIHREFAPTLKTAAADAPRFEYASDGQSVGLLIESSASNLQRYGSDFASWSNSANISITSNAAVAPNGLLEADLAVAGPLPTTTSKYVYDSSPSVASGTTYTASVYMKDAGQRYVQLLGGGSAFPSSQYATFDLQTGSVDANGVTASASSVGNGWVRIQATFVANATSTAGIAITFVDSATSAYLPTFTGNDFDGLLLWGFQLETGSAASSLVNSGTSSSGVTRASDSCSVATSSFGYTGGPVSVIAEANMTSPTTETSQKSVFELGDGTSDNRIWVYNNFGKADSLYVRADGVTGMFEAGTVTTDDDFTVAARVDTNNSGRSTNGGSVTSDTSVVIPSGLDTLYIGRSKSTSVNALNGHIKRLSLFNVALSDVELQSLTSS